MSVFQKSFQGLAAVALAAGALTLTACEEDRSAEAETAVSEAEVSTELPEEVVSDAQLEATANAAADVAAAPPPIVVPAPAGGAESAPAATGAVAE